MRTPPQRIGTVVVVGAAVGAGASEVSGRAAAELVGTTVTSVVPTVGAAVVGTATVDSIAAELEAEASAATELVAAGAGSDEPPSRVSTSGPGIG